MQHESGFFISFPDPIQRFFPSRPISFSFLASYFIHILGQVSFRYYFLAVFAIYIVTINAENVFVKVINVLWDSTMNTFLKYTYLFTNDYFLFLHQRISLSFNSAFLAPAFVFPFLSCNFVKIINGLGFSAFGTRFFKHKKSLLLEMTIGTYLGCYRQQKAW